MMCRRWLLSFAWGVMLANGKNPHRDMLADALPNQTLDDQVLLLQTDFQFKQDLALEGSASPSKHEVLAGVQTASSLDHEKNKTAFKVAGGDDEDVPSENMVKTIMGNASTSSDAEHSIAAAPQQTQVSKAPAAHAPGWKDMHSHQRTAILVEKKGTLEQLDTDVSNANEFADAVMPVEASATMHFHDSALTPLDRVVEASLISSGIL